MNKMLIVLAILTSGLFLHGCVHQGESTRQPT